MALFEGKTPAERNKMIVAIAFGALALLLLGRMFFSSDAPPRRTSNSNNRNSNVRTTTNSDSRDSQLNAPGDPTLQIPREVIYTPVTYSVPDAGRNIFAFYIAPTAQPRATAVAEVPTPTPVPPPPLMLGSISPSSVTARTGDFTLQLSGDKFTPQARVYVDGQELPTTFASAQQLSTRVPAALIAAPGARQIVVRTPDNQLYSNETALNVSAPPTPQFTFVGILGGPRYNDKAILKAQDNELKTVTRGEFADKEKRFKVTNISTRAVELTDVNLQIKHTLPYVENRASGGPPSGPSPRYNPPVKPADNDGDDDEPQD